MKIKFTKTAILALPLPPQGKRATAYDTEVPKLAVRITSAGIRTFYVIKHLPDTVAWVKLGLFPETTVEQARTLAQKTLGEFAEGSNPMATKRAFRAEPTLSEFFVEYGTRHGENKRSWKSDVERFNLYLKSPLGKLKLSAITRNRVADVFANAQKSGKATGTVRAIRALISHMLSMAVSWGYLETNPAAGIKITGKIVSRTRFLQPGEMRPFFLAVAMEEELTRDYILLALLTGARRANLSTMRWEAIDLETGEWRIARTKNGEPQTVTLCPEALEILERRRETSPGEEQRIVLKRAARGDLPLPTGFVFPGAGETGHIVEPKKALMRVLERAGIPYGRKTENGLTLHDLRRTLGSWQARSGASLAIIGKSLNHKSIQSTAIYARLDLDPVRQSVNTATSAMLDAAGLKDSAAVSK